MATYLMLGKYSVEGLKGMSAKRTDKLKALLKKNGGELKAGYAALGGVDLVLIVDLPDTARDGNLRGLGQSDRGCLYDRTRGHGRGVRQARGMSAMRQERVLRKRFGIGSSLDNGVKSGVHSEATANVCAIMQNN